jgi:hypothetical protein
MTQSSEISTSSNNRPKVVSPPVGVSKEQFNNVVSAAYTAYLSFGRTPSIKEISTYSNCQKRTIAKVLDSKDFREVIAARGVNWEGTRGLSSKQMLALSVLSNPADRRDLRAKLKSIGATYAEYQAWMAQPVFNNKAITLAETMIQDNISNVHQALTQQALNGNTKAIEMFYQISGRHDPAQKQVVQMEIIIKLLLEILTKRITDRGVLDAILTDIEEDVMPKMITSSIVKG